MHTVNAVGEELDLQTAAAFVSNAVNAGALSAECAGLIMTAIGNNALRPVELDKRDAVRASIFKHMLVETISD
jgi:transcriptional regulator CtsR